MTWRVTSQGFCPAPAGMCASFFLTITSFCCSSAEALLASHRSRLNEITLDRNRRYMPLLGSLFVLDRFRRPLAVQRQNLDLPPDWYRTWWKADLFVASSVAQLAADSYCLSAWP